MPTFGFGKHPTLLRIKSTTPSVSYVLANEEAPSEECTLIVQHSPRALRIAIRETLSNHIRLLHEYETASEAETGVEQGDLFTHLQPVYTEAHITQCQLYVQTGHFALIPSELFDPTIGLRYLDMTANLPDGLTAASTNHGVFTNVFAVDTSLLIQLKNLHLPLTRICHQVDVQHVFATP